MRLKDGRVTILFNHEGLTIDVTDNGAGIEFASIKLNQEQTCQALSRLAHTKCEIEVRGLDNVGKVKEMSSISFPMPDGHDYSNSKEMAIAESSNHCPEGWVADPHFNSQGSFFFKDSVLWAQCSISRWVSPD